MYVAQGARVFANCTFGRTRLVKRQLASSCTFTRFLHVLLPLFYFLSVTTSRTSTTVLLLVVLVLAWQYRGVHTALQPVWIAAKLCWLAKVFFFSLRTRSSYSLQYSLLLAVTSSCQCQSYLLLVAPCLLVLFYFQQQQQQQFIYTAILYIIYTSILIIIIV